MKAIRETEREINRQTDRQTAPGLPDGIFSKQKAQFGSMLEGLGMENAGHLEYVFYGHLGPFGNLVVIWYISPRFGILYQEKSGNLGQHELKVSSAMLVADVIFMIWCRMNF
jgi:hypothetical protein